MINNPLLIVGGKNSDERGKIFHVNKFDLTSVKRIYIIENKNIFISRGWKGHMIESRWFFCSKGSIEIQIAAINSFSTKNNELTTFILSDDDLNILYVPKGHATMVRQIKDKSRLVALSDFKLGVSNDEDLRWESNFFEI
jgi:dTDP-4-dehydrorhamnose 3,5-epimerase-like enzyme